jgi:hypothetical protein
MTFRPKWLRLTEETSALDFLEQGAKHIQETESNRTAWKWVIICLYGALYGFAISACRGTSDTSVLMGKKLFPFDKALKLCKGLRIKRYGAPLALTASQAKSIKKLKKLRDDFEHFQPAGWSIEIHGMPKIAIDILDVIRFLAIDASMFSHLKDAQKKRIKSYVFQSKRALKKSVLYREAVIAEAQKV